MTIGNILIFVLDRSTLDPDSLATWNNVLDNLARYQPLSRLYILSRVCPLCLLFCRLSLMFCRMCLLFCRLCLLFCSLSLLPLSRLYILSRLCPLCLLFCRLSLLPLSRLSLLPLSRLSLLPLSRLCLLFCRLSLLPLSRLCLLFCRLCGFCYSFSFRNAIAPRLVIVSRKHPRITRILYRHQTRWSRGLRRRRHFRCCTYKSWYGLHPSIGDMECFHSRSPPRRKARHRRRIHPITPDPLTLLPLLCCHSPQIVVYYN